MDPTTTPTHIFRTSDTELGISWEDGHESRYSLRALRLACKCARCVHEITKVPLLEPASVPMDIKPEKIEPVGRYGICVTWSDGHDTGIATFRDLRALCPCEQCQTG
jgi:ATP-binding protein involved in chromosome partitioning